jgi:hypothetical protein
MRPGYYHGMKHVETSRWRTVSTPGFVTGSAFIALIIYLLASDGNRYIRILDDANLAFHEAGHIFFGILGSTLGLYGGTLGQLVFPAIAATAFLRGGQTISFSLCSIWLFENLFNIARYMADARAQVLPLVGGGEHDWTNIFSRWGALQHDTKIASFFRFVGWIGILSTWAWLAWRWNSDRKESANDI